jgi:dGTPase
MTPYERLLAITDYVSGMTDRFAVQLYQRLSGIRLPD